jgi:hypothetical protein
MTHIQHLFVSHTIARPAANHAENTQGCRKGSKSGPLPQGEDALAALIDLPIDGQRATVPNVAQVVG